MIKTLIKNILISTMLSIAGIAIAGSVLGASMIYISTIYQIICLNILLHLLFIGIYKLDISNLVLEILVEYGTLNFIMVSSSFLFGWHKTMPLLAIIVITLVVYIIIKMIDSAHLYSSVEDINQQIKINKQEKNV